MDLSKKFDQQIYSDKLTTLYTSNWISTAATLSVGALYVGLQLPYHPGRSLFSWFGFLALIYACRFFLTRRYLKQEHSREEQHLWMRFFRCAVFLTGLTLGSTILFFYPGDDVPHRMFTVLLLAGMAAGGLTVLVADLICFRGYVYSLLLPVIITSFLAADALNVSMALLVCVFLSIILRASRRLNDIVTSSLQLRYENSALVDILEEEKKQLNNRLGRIFNDSSNELYIADASSLNFLQVNKGALLNLGRNEDEMSAMTLLDTIVDLDKKGFDKLIAPIQSGARDSVSYKTLHRRKDGSTYPVELRFQLSNQESPPILVITAIDITERDEAERKLLHQANYDQLTDLPNRYYMQSYIGSAFARARRGHSKVSLLFIDLNNFKDINDTLGHGIGDELLKQVADRIRPLLRGVDTAARLGGDEFLILLEGLQKQEQAEVVIQKIINSFKEPFHVESNEIFTSASIGVSTFPDDGDSVELLMQYADTAMYNAKKDSTRDYCFFSHELREYIDRQLAVKNHLRHAVSRGELSVFYQPKVDTNSEKIIGAEALVRWNNPELGNVPPEMFIPVAEKYGLIEEVGNWVLKAACKEASRWQETAETPLHIAVNISPRQFRTTDFLDTVDEALSESGLPEHLLEIEITENLLIQDTTEPLEILNALHKKNIVLSLDDFGTGYSSLSYLKQFPLQVLKIDRSFINDMMMNQFNMSLVDAIVALAHNLGLSLVAEGVETREQLDWLRSKNVDVIQGFFFSPPVPAGEFGAMLQKQSLS
jgi:diguanylate cyclase (GGDEF)-like protein/PAS domain S-box-containing protein